MPETFNGSVTEHKNILNYISDQPWLATESVVSTMLTVAQGLTDPKIVEARLGRPLDNTQSVVVRNGIAILSVNGPISRYSSWFHSVSGGTSVQILAKDFNIALEDNDIKGIILDIDSGGGEVNGTSEFSKMVFNARSRKPIIAYVGGQAASGAYWIASAASEIVLSETAILGSIGTVVRVRDTSNRDEKNGVREFDIVSRKSPLKRVDANTDPGREVILKTLDSITNVFISTVALNRNVTVEKVESDFGKGGVLVGEENVEFGLADRIGSLESLITEMSTEKNNEEEFNMTTEKTGVENKPTPITIESLKASNPEMVEAFRKEGASAELIRIKGVQEKMMVGHEKLIETMMFDGVTSPNEAASKILGAEKAKISGVQNDLEADAKDIEPIGAGDVPGAEVKAEDEAVNAMVEGADGNKK
jgi:signal peptide peptidase SppA